MASTNFLVFDEGKQNMMSDGDYSANTQRARGVTPGIAYPNLHNKLYYQVSVMAKAIADFMVAQGANASDEDVEQLTADISTAFTNFVDNKTKDVYLPLSGGTMNGNIAFDTTSREKHIANKNDEVGINIYNKGIKISDWSISEDVLSYSTGSRLLQINQNVTAPTPSTSDNSTKIATTAFVQSLLTNKFTASKQQNGWWKDGNTGIIHQWGYEKALQNGDNVNIYFPITFNTVLNAGFTIKTTTKEDADDLQQNGIISLNKNGMTVFSYWIGIEGYYWYAIGY